MLLAPLVATNVPVMEYTKTPIPEFMHGPVICSAITYIKWKVCSVGCSLPSVIISPSPAHTATGRCSFSQDAGCR